jgi:hypothetical protein
LWVALLHAYTTGPWDDLEQAIFQITHGFRCTEARAWTDFLIITQCANQWMPRLNVGSQARNHAVDGTSRRRGRHALCWSQSHTLLLACGHTEHKGAKMNPIEKKIGETPFSYLSRF